jgi:hypothetical protein
MIGSADAYTTLAIAGPESIHDLPGTLGRDQEADETAHDPADQELPEAAHDPSSPSSPSATGKICYRHLGSEA